MTQPVETSHFVRWAAACLFAALLSPGCAHTTTVTAWTPAVIDASGTQRVTVLGFTGDQQDEAIQNLKAGLEHNALYTVVDQQDFQQVIWTSGEKASAGILSLDTLHAARESHVDLIVLGEVLESSCHDRPVDSLEQDSSAGPPTDVSREPADMQTMHREATVTIAFRFIDVPSGEVRTAEQASHSYQGEVVIGQPGTRTHREVLDALTRQCVDKFTSMLAPQELEQEVTLAKPTLLEKGYSLVWNGNEFACRCRWDEAIVAWEQALSCNPENDAALHNLSIAHAHRQNFAQAETMAIKAVNLRHTPLYESSLERIRQQRADFDTTLLQRCNLNGSCR